MPVQPQAMVSTSLTKPAQATIIQSIKPALLEPIISTQALLPLVESLLATTLSTPPSLRVRCVLTTLLPTVRPDQLPGLFTSKIPSGLVMSALLTSPSITQPASRSKKEI